MSSAPPYTFAYQPIVDLAARQIISYEALIRGCNGESAATILGAYHDSDAHALHRDSRQLAIVLAARLGLAASLNLNVTPRGLAAAGAVEVIVDSAVAAGLDPARIVLEVTEDESITDAASFSAAVTALRRAGLSVAIDDFGAGYSGLNLLADFQPDCIKLDMRLVRSINNHGPRQAIVRALLVACADLGIDVIAEGVETADECAWFRDEGVRLFQGYWFARPGFEHLPGVNFETAAAPTESGSPDRAAPPCAGQDILPSRLEA